jgi:hypothetical protein
MFGHASYVVSMYVVQGNCSLYMYHYLRNDQFSFESIRFRRADCKSFPKRAFFRPGRNSRGDCLGVLFSCISCSFT